MTGLPGPVEVGAGSTAAVVPLRDGRTGKTRLAGPFSPAQRTRIVTALARHVVGTLLAAGPVSRVLVVTGDPDFARRALPADARLEVVAEPADRRGLNAAVTLGRARALADGARRVLVVHADLALLTADDVAALLAPTAPLVLAPDRADRGTNALVLDAAVTGFAFRFGAASARAHRDQARALGLRTATVRRPGTWTDLDTPEDWLALPEAVRERLDPSGALRAAQPDR